MRLAALLLPVALAAAEVPAEFDSYVVNTEMVAMRDGVRLATDVYRPARRGAAVEGKFPALVTRSPYNKNGERAKAIFFAQRGYVFVAQDCRGRYRSEGRLYPLVNEGRDGYDTIEWAARQPWSDGKIATTGASYLAMDQFSAAVYRPPHLVAMYAAVGGLDYYHESAYRGGVPGLGWPVWLLDSAARAAESRGDAAARDRLNALVRTPAAWLALHPRERESAFAGFSDQIQAYRDFYAHPEFDAYWQQPGFDNASRVGEMKDVPMLLLTGWYDSDSTIRAFTALSQSQKTPKKLIVGPWPHGYGKPECGDAWFGEAAALDERGLQIDWFDHCLKGRALKAVEAVRYFRMGGGPGRNRATGKLEPGGEWRTADRWPPRGSGTVRYYLEEAGRLGAAPGRASQPFDFVFDPERPVPTIGRHGPTCIQDQVCRPDIPGCTDALPLSKRPDVLSFSTAPLAEAVEATGSVRIRLFVASDAPDTDFTAKLIDVWPDGYAMILADGQVRMRYRDGAGKALPISPGRVYEAEIDLGAISNRFAAGHRIRLDISSSNYPKIEPNPNTGEFAGEWTKRRKARNTVYAGGERASYIKMPVVK